MALVTLRAFRDPIDAELTRAQLESQGIRAVVFDQHVAGIQWLYSYAVGGVKVKVEEADLAAAREALTSRSEDLDALEIQATSTPADGCPACGSLEIGASRVDRMAGAASLLAGFPFLAWRWRWHCRACGHSWRADRAAEAPVAPETVEAEALVHERRSYPLVLGYVAILVALAVLLYVQHQIRNPS